MQSFANFVWRTVHARSFAAVRQRNLHRSAPLLSARCCNPTVVHLLPPPCRFLITIAHRPHCKTNARPQSRARPPFCRRPCSALLRANSCPPAVPADTDLLCAPFLVWPLSPTRTQQVGSGRLPPHAHSGAPEIAHPRLRNFRL